MDDETQGILNLNAAEYLVAVRRGKHPYITPAAYLKHAKKMGAQEGVVVDLAAQIEQGKRPLSRYVATPLYLHGDGSLQPHATT